MPLPTAALIWSHLVSARHARLFGSKPRFRPRHEPARRRQRCRPRSAAQPRHRVHRGHRHAAPARSRVRPADRVGRAATDLSRWYSAAVGARDFRASATNSHATSMARRRARLLRPLVDLPATIAAVRELRLRDGSASLGRSSPYGQPAGSCASPTHAATGLSTSVSRPTTRTSISAGAWPMTAGSSSTCHPSRWCMWAEQAATPTRKRRLMRTGRARYYRRHSGLAAPSPTARSCSAPTSASGRSAASEASPASAGSDVADPTTSASWHRLGATGAQRLDSRTATSTGSTAYAGDSPSPMLELSTV